KTSGEKGKIKVTFSDDSYIETEEQKLYVFPHITASTYSNVPNDAITTNFFLGEGTKVKDGNVIKEGNADHPTVYRTYNVKPGTDVSEYKLLATRKNIFDTIAVQALDVSYTNVQWEPNNFVASDNNKVFTAKATKRYRVTFEFKGLDLDTSKDIDADTLSKSLKDKMPEADWVKRGDAYKPVKPDNFTEIIKDDGQVTKIYDWTFAGWNPTGIPSASEDKKLVGTWKRTQATSAQPTVEKITESDKVIKGQGKAGATIKVTIKDNTSLETVVGQDKNWEVKITKDLKKDEKVSVTQTEMGKKESAKKEVIVTEKAKENNKPGTNPMPKPENNPDNKKQPNPRVTPDKKPLPSPEKKDKENQSGSNYFGLRFKNHTSKTTRVKTQVENKKQNNLENNSNKEEARYIIDVMSGNYQVIKDGARQNRKMDVLPVIKNDRLMLPLRNLAEMIGAKVEWDQQTRTAIFTNKDLVAKIQIDGNEIVLSNGKVIKMDSKPLNINGRILLSVSNVANVFGLTNGNTKDGIDQNIEWDGDNKTVEIKLNK
ncbi:stalk domain-containing protein, partial [Peptoniphilus asaccharolyticus]